MGPEAFVTQANLGKKNSKGPRLVSPRRLVQAPSCPPSPLPASCGAGLRKETRCYLFNVLVPRPPL